MKVSTALRCLAGRSSCPPAEESVKDVTKATEVKSLKALPEEPFAISMSEVVISSALIWVREHLVGFVYLLKLILSPIIAVMVGVILEGQLTKSPLYFLVGSIIIDTENLVIIPFCWHPFSTSPPSSPSPSKERGRGI